ncbi:hypothetical protein B9Z19DRAFT_1190028, partial [Tuber borchii]
MVGKLLANKGFTTKKVSSVRATTSRAKNQKDRTEVDVVIFNYSLSRAVGNPLVEGSGLGIFGENDDIFSQALNDSLIESERFNQERVGAFRAMVQMISNRMDPESWILGNFQVSLRTLEEDIDQMISDAENYEDDRGVKRKQKRVQGLLTSLNRLSASFCRTKIKDYEKRYSLRQNPFYKNFAPIPILLENSEQIWLNTLDSIDLVARKRKCFHLKIEALVENMKIERKIFSAFLKSNQAKTAPSERTAQEARDAMKSIEDAVKKTLAEIVLQGRTVDGFIGITRSSAAILPKFPYANSGWALPLYFWNSTTVTSDRHLESPICGRIQNPSQKETEATPQGQVIPR